MLKQKYNSKFFHLISNINKAFEKRQSTLFLKNSPSNTELLKVLLKEGFILSFKEYNNVVIIKLKLVNGFNKRIASPIKNTMKISKLIKEQRREGGSTLYLLNTDKGLLTSLKAIEKNVGGQVLLKLS